MSAPGQPATPTRPGPALRAVEWPVARWQRLALAPGEIALWWLGQAGFAIRHGGLSLLVDPYLSDSLAVKYARHELSYQRLMPPPIAPDQLRSLDWVLCTHAHSDHMDPGTLPSLTRNNPGCRFIVPRAAIETARARGLEEQVIVGVGDGESLSLGAGARVTAVASAHEELQTDARGDHLFLGYWIELGKVTLYHSGDAVPYSGLAERLKDREVSVALLPVNGRDDRRRSHGVPGNFTLDEALQLCRTLAIPLMLAHHFGLFEFNTVDRAWLDARAGAQHQAPRLIVPEIDQALLIG